ncbi:MAG: InlB B-repeat-containing protein, partial [Bacilli bacterium]|nr:InlB B-repeat-containing protein [Bacilli bacterium]
CSNEGNFAAHVSVVDYFGNTGSAGWTENFYVTAHISFALAYNPSTGGTITGNTIQTVNYGENGTGVTAVPNTGYIFDKWSDGVTTASRTDLNVTSNINVTAIFEKIQYALTYTPSTGGTITGNASQTVNYGENGTGVTAVPNTGYIFDKWSDGVATASRKDLNVTSNINVTAQFRGDYIDATSSGITFDDNKGLILTLNSKFGIDLSTVSYYVNYYIDKNNDLLNFVGPESYLLKGSDTHNSSQIIHTVDRGNNGNNTYKAIVTLKNSSGYTIQILEFIKQSK